MCRVPRTLCPQHLSLSGDLLVPSICSVPRALLSSACVALQIFTFCFYAAARVSQTNADLPCLAICRLTPCMSVATLVLRLRSCFCREHGYCLCLGIPFAAASTGVEVKLSGFVAGVESLEGKNVHRLPCFCSWGSYLKPVDALPFLDLKIISSV